MPWIRDYFDGYSAEAPHPHMASTGSEGRCDLCGRRITRDHDKPWFRTHPQWVWHDTPADNLDEPEVYERTKRPGAGAVPFG